MGEQVKIIECPRDAWQGLPVIIPAELKANYLRKLVAAGFRHIDAVSFVSPAAVPQMAESEQVLGLLGALDDVEILGIVVNVKGAERAIATGAVRTLGFPYSISARFLQRNQHQTQQESLQELQTIVSLAHGSGLDVVAYLSMAFGSPYSETWSLSQVNEACGLLIDVGVRQISLADTVGVATPSRVANTVAEVFAAHPDVELGVHLHARPDEAPAKVEAAYGAGCRRFDAAIGGLGGCPFAQDTMVGNLPAETLIETLRTLGAQLPQLRPLDQLIETSAEIAQKFGVAPC
jgi:hydroxymethylglutaryl-CoA lyase